MNEIPTPRTDAHFLKRLKEQGAVDKRDERFARQLERENDVMMRTLGAVRTALREAEERRQEPAGVRAVVHDAVAEVCQMRRAYEEGNK